MFHTDHPPPHFHALYAEHEALIGIDPIVVISDGLPPRAQRLVLRWATIRQQELAANWNRAVNLQPLKAIAPLA